MLCYVMVPLLPPVNCVEDSWGWWLHATSASGRRAPATEHVWMPKSKDLEYFLSISYAGGVGAGSHAGSVRCTGGDRREAVSKREGACLRSRGGAHRYNFRMTCPMTARLETTIFSVRSLNLLPGAQPNDGKGSAVPNRLTKGCAPKGTKGVNVLESNLGLSPQRARVLTAKPGISWIMEGESRRLSRPPPYFGS
jgi:hypothetical protein